MKRCTYCGQRAVSEQTASGLCFKCGHLNTKVDYFMQRWAPVMIALILLGLSFLASLLMVGMLHE